jgi:DNA repair protein RecO
MRHTKALILKREEWGEADWLISALTEDFGRIRLLAQGARKHGAKLQGHLEPGSFSDISFVIGRNGYRLTIARLFEPPMAVSAPLFKLRFLAAILATLEANLLEEPGSGGELFQVARESIHALSAAEGLGDSRRIFVWFTVRFLRCLGLLPSPFVAEGRMMPSLVELVRQPGMTALVAGSDPARLEDELSRLCRELTSAVRVIFPPAFADALGGGV